ncbi:MAG TPA: hypothetical protein VNQ74_09915, partial [Burkholderiaceae bacterium]|nr:hypothetical protein [Burkholderiaceae bacterium]
MAFLPFSKLGKGWTVRRLRLSLNRYVNHGSAIDPSAPELEQFGEVRRLSMLLVGDYPRPRYGATPCSGTHMPLGSLPVCQNTS